MLETGSNDLGLHVQIEITLILTVCCSSHRFFASGQFAAAELILTSTTKPLRRRPDHTQLLLLLMAGDVHQKQKPCPTTKFPRRVCTRNVATRGVSIRCNIYSGWLHAKCSGLLNAAQYRRNKDWTCDTCSASKTQQSTPPPPSPPPSPPPTSAPSAKQISYDSTFNVQRSSAQR